MPIYDRDAQYSYPIQKVCDRDAQYLYPIQKVCDRDAQYLYPIYTAEGSHTLTYSRTQDGTWGYNEIQNTEGFTCVKFTEFIRGKSYGKTLTRVEIIRNGTVVQTLADVYAEYNPAGEYSMGGTDLPLDTEIAIQHNDYIRIAMCANYNPDISGQFTSECSVSFIFY